MQEELRKVTNELNRKKTEVTTLQKKMKEIENIIEVKSHNASFEYSPELLTIVRELKREVENLEDFQKKRNFDSNIQQKVVFVKNKIIILVSDNFFYIKAFGRVGGASKRKV